MLDWDKPLSEQPQVVKALRPLADRVPGLSDALQSFELSSTKGQTVNDYISRSFSPDQAAQMLRDAGIPGIKYLDEGSRQPGVTSMSQAQLDTRIDILKKDIDSGLGNQDRMKQILSALEAERASHPKLTRNFVVFPGNENMLTILERNNQPVQQAMQEFEQGLTNFMATR